jgi:hypothetical protein
MFHCKKKNNRLARPCLASIHLEPHASVIAFGFIQWFVHRFFFCSLTFNTHTFLISFDISYWSRMGSTLHIEAPMHSIQWVSSPFGSHHNCHCVPLCVALSPSAINRICPVEWREAIYPLHLYCCSIPSAHSWCTNTYGSTATILTRHLSGHHVPHVD